MALDKNLFTLNIEPSKIEPSALDLVDPSNTIHYRKRFVPNETNSYMFTLSDPLSESILATATAPSATSKEKVIELHNPSVTVPLTFKGTLTFKWVFSWDGNTFEWKREACYMVRKPDPPVIVAVTKEPAGKIKTSTVQILDYNLNRFDIDDRKGLEIVLLTSLLSFSDYSEQLKAKNNDSAPPAVNTNVPPAVAAPLTKPPTPPPKPEDWKEDQIAILQAKEQRDVNEVVIGEAGTIDEYVKYCVSLLNDDTLLFITLRSHVPTCVSKVVQVAEATKRTRYKINYDDDELHQYVDMSFEESASKKGKAKGPRVINLDDPPSTSVPPTASTYEPPNTLTIHLSKIAMPELEPKSKKPKPRPRAGPSGQPAPALSVPELSNATPADKRLRRLSTPAQSAVLTKPSPQAPAPPSSGFLAKVGALASSRSPSPPPSSRRHSTVLNQLPVQPQQPQSLPTLAQPQPRRPRSSPRLRPPPQLSPQPSPQPLPQQPKASHPHHPPPHSHPTLQQPYPPPTSQHAHARSITAPGPHFNPAQPVAHTRAQTTSAAYSPVGHMPPFLSPLGPFNAPPVNPAYAVPPGFAGPIPVAPAPQRAPGKTKGKGLFGGSKR